MRLVPLLTDWSVSPKRGLFDGMGRDSAPAVAVTLPHDAMLGFERSADAPSGEHGGYFPGGAVEYTRTLEIDPDEVETVHTLVFDGVYRDAMVYVNDEFAAQRPHGYSRFAVRLDPFLRAGTNVLRVESRAHKDSRWYSGLGIHRNVWLATSPLVHIALDGIQVSTPDVDDEGALVQVDTTVANDGLRTRTVVAVATVRAPDGAIVAAGRTPITLLAGESGVARERLWVAEPQRWSLDSPVLYRAEVTLEGAVEGQDVVDADAATFGIRTLQLDPRHGLRINGESVKLRGACIHHDNGILGAKAIAQAEERRVRILKDAGFNAIRSAHNPLAPETLEACDRIGMLVMDESFDMWVEAKSPFDYSLSFPEWWERDIESMVAKDFNHPSVVFYSIGNEIPETGRPHGSRLGRLLADRVRALDPTRFTTNSINGLVSVIKELPPMGADDGPRDINDTMADPGAMMTAIVGSDLVTGRTEESFAAVDATGLNYGDSRYAADAVAFPNRVIIGTETFATRLDHAWPLILANDHVIGEFTWTGWDYLGEAGIGRVDYTETGGAFVGTAGPFPWQLAWCGDIDITGVRRPASYFREIVYGLRDRPYLAVRRPRTDGLQPAQGPWSWSDSIASWSWDVELGTTLTVEVYSDAETVELLLNDTSVATAAAGAENGHRAIFEIAFAPGELVAVASNGGVETGRETLRSARGGVQLRASAERARIEASLDDLAYVPISLTDADGTVWPGHDRDIEVSVDGPGELLGLGSADPRTTLSYLGSRTRTFDGRAQAIIRPTGAGEISIRVSAEGLETTTVVVEAE